MVSAPKINMPISGAEAGIKSASAGDQEPERKVREIWWEARVWVKAARISGVSSRSPSPGVMRGGLVVVAQVRRRLGRVASRMTEAL
jgi:hypothetical protein